jgi:hypothetical protein
VSSALERHYTVPQIAKIWCMSNDTVRSLFRDEPGVIKFGTEETRYKRPYISIRVPESVMFKVHSKIKNRPV